ncbi:secretory carrier membrane protein 2 [Cricetulus griseus]
MRQDLILSFYSPAWHGTLYDPSVTQLTNAPQGGLAEFNPFSEASHCPGEHGPQWSCVLQLLLRQASKFLPARFLAAGEPSERQMLLGGDSIPRDSYMRKLPKAVAAAAQAGLLRQQEELDRKAAELERKERELQNTAANLHGCPWKALPSRDEDFPVVVSMEPPSL